MPRDIKTAEDIQLEVQRLLVMSETVRDDGVQLDVPRPRLLAQTDASGCNWDMDYWRNARGYEDAIRHAVATVQAKWNLDAGFPGSTFKVG